MFYKKGKKIFLKVSQNSHEYSCAGISSLIKGIRQKLEAWNRFRYSRFPLNFVYFLKTFIWLNICERPLMKLGILNDWLIQFTPKSNSKTSVQKEVLWENMFLDTLKLFVFEFQVLNNCFTGQLPLNAFTCYFENFLHVTKNIVNSQVIPLQALFWLLCSLCQKKCQTYFLSEDLLVLICRLRLSLLNILTPSIYHRGKNRNK